MSVGTKFSFAIESNFWLILDLFYEGCCTNIQADSIYDRIRAHLPLYSFLSVHRRTAYVNIFFWIKNFACKIAWHIYTNFRSNDEGESDDSDSSVYSGLDEEDSSEDDESGEEEEGEDEESDGKDEESDGGDEESGGEDEENEAEESNAEEVGLLISISLATL